MSDLKIAGLSRFIPVGPMQSQGSLKGKEKGIGENQRNGSLRRTQPNTDGFDDGGMGPIKE